jgi:hypothetical protein
MRAVRLIVLAMMVVLRVTTASAQTQPPATPSPDAVAAAKELLAIMSPDLVGQMMRGMVAQMWPQIERSFGPKIDAATSAELRAEFEHTTQQFVLDSMQDMPQIYARYFTADELHQLAAFYKTPLGAKALSQIPKVMADFSATMLPRMTAFQQQLQGRLQVILEKHGVK